MEMTMKKKRISAILFIFMLAVFSSGCSMSEKTSSSSNAVPIHMSVPSIQSAPSSDASVPSPESSSLVSSAPSLFSEPKNSSAPPESTAPESASESTASRPSSAPGSSQAASSAPADPVQRVYSTRVPPTKDIVFGADVRSGEGASVDCSNSSEGFIIVKYGGSGTGGRLKTQVIKSGGSTYNFDIAPNKEEILPLTQGGGTYTVNVVEGIGGTNYAVMFSCTIEVTLRDELLPFLYSNKFVDIDSAPDARAKAADLSYGRSTDVEVTSAVFDYVTKTLVYDHELAATVKSGYIPVLDRVMANKKGICFDYASLMTGMLRHNRIPCKLAIGYAGDVYHAWIDVWLDGKGWVGGLIFYDGKGWQMMDPTFVSAYLDNPKLNSLFSKGVSYTRKYQY